MAQNSARCRRRGSRSQQDKAAEEPPLEGREQGLLLEARVKETFARKFEARAEQARLDAERAAKELQDAEAEARSRAEAARLAALRAQEALREQQNAEQLAIWAQEALISRRAAEEKSRTAARELDAAAAEAAAEARRFLRAAAAASTRGAEGEARRSPREHYFMDSASEFEEGGGGGSRTLHAFSGPSERWGPPRRHTTWGADGQPFIKSMFCTHTGESSKRRMEKEVPEARQAELAAQQALRPTGSNTTQLALRPAATAVVPKTAFPAAEALIGPDPAVYSVLQMPSGEDQWEEAAGGGRTASLLMNLGLQFGAHQSLMQFADIAAAAAVVEVKGGGEN